MHLIVNRCGCIFIVVRISRKNGGIEGGKYGDPGNLKKKSRRVDDSAVIFG